MQYPVEVILQRAQASPDIGASVFDAVSGLEHFCDHILGCQVFVRGPEASDDGVYVVSLKIRTPDAEITIAGSRLNNPEHRSLQAALRDAFAQARRELHLLALPLCTCSAGLHHMQPVQH